MAKIEESFYKRIFEDSRDSLSEALLKSKGQSVLDIIQQGIEKRSSEQGLDIETICLSLLSINNFDNREKIHELIINSSRVLRKSLFKNYVSPMVPIEVSSFCASNCSYCGWRKDNKEIPRLRISMDALEVQASDLAKAGFKHFEISSGDDLKFLKKDIGSAIKRIKKGVTTFCTCSYMFICMESSCYCINIYVRTFVCNFVKRTLYGFHCFTAVYIVNNACGVIFCFGYIF